MSSSDLHAWPGPDVPEAPEPATHDPGGQLNANENPSAISDDVNVLHAPPPRPARPRDKLVRSDLQYMFEHSQDTTKKYIHLQYHYGTHIYTYWDEERAVVVKRIMTPPDGKPRPRDDMPDPQQIRHEFWVYPHYLAPAHERCRRQFPPATRPWPFPELVSYEELAEKDLPGPRLDISFIPGRNLYDFMEDTPRVSLLQTLVGLGAGGRLKWSKESNSWMGEGKKVDYFTEEGWWGDSVAWLGFGGK